MQLYLDMDGVLADFDKRATQILGMIPSLYEDRYGAKAFWDELQSTPDFYNSFEPMLDMPFLIDATESLNPIVLTGVPMGEWAKPQKIEWVKRHLPGLQVIACRSKDKSNYCQPGDVIVDDRTEYRHLWKAKGGGWVHHISAYDSIKQLKQLGVID